MRTDKENMIVRMSFEFAVKIIALSEELEQGRKFVLANQILKSGTSIGANIREAQNAASRADFINKMKIAAKEADETIYWLELCKASPNYPDRSDLIEEATSINKVLSKIISTSKNHIK